MSFDFRTKCKKCRFDRCLAVGLQRDRVLNEEDRQKYSHPKRKHAHWSGTPPLIPLSHEYCQTSFQRIFGSKDNDQLMDGLVQELVLGHIHTNRPGWQESHTKNLRMMLFFLEKKFRQWAYENVMFQSLSPNHQLLLLQHNTKLFIQLCLARYFGESDGESQLSTLFVEPNLGE